MNKYVKYSLAAIFGVVVALLLDKDPVKYITEEKIISNLDTVFIKSDTVTVFKRVEKKVYYPEIVTEIVSKTDTIEIPTFPDLFPDSVLTHKAVYLDTTLEITTTVLGKVLAQELEVKKPLFAVVKDTVYQEKEVIKIKPSPYLYAGIGRNLDEPIIGLTYKPSNRFLVTGYTGKTTRGLMIQYGFLSKNK